MATIGGLSAGGSPGSQTVTQNPQASTQTASLGQSQTVQTSAASSLLNAHTGIPLTGTAVPTVNLAATTVTTAPPTPTSKSHGTNPVLFGFSLLLFVAAATLFWTTFRSSSVKTTTK